CRDTAGFGRGQYRSRAGHRRTAGGRAHRVRAARRRGLPPRRDREDDRYRRRNVPRAASSRAQVVDGGPRGDRGRTMTHLTFEQISELADQREPSTEQAAHLAECGACGVRLERVRALVASARTLPREMSPPPEVWDALRARVRAE